MEKKTNLKMSKVALQTGAYMSQIVQLRDLDYAILQESIKNVSDNLNVLGAIIDDNLLEVLHRRQNHESQDLEMELVRKIHWKMRNAIEQARGEVAVTVQRPQENTGF